MGALDHAARKLIVHPSPSRTKRSTDFMALLETLDGLYGPRPGLPTKPVVIVLDNGPIHVSKATIAALAARPTGSPSNGCPNTRPNSTTSKRSGTISKRKAWPWPGVSLEPSSDVVRISCQTWKRQFANVPPLDRQWSPEGKADVYWLSAQQRLILSMTVPFDHPQSAG